MATKVDPDNDFKRQNRISGIKHATITNQVMLTESYLSSVIYNRNEESCKLLQDINKEL